MIHKEFFFTHIKIPTFADFSAEGGM